MKKRKMKEIGRGGVAEYLCKQVKKRGGWAEKFASPGRRGVPDYIVTWPSKMHLVETKSPTGKLRVLQKQDHKWRARYGIAVFVLPTKSDVDLYIAAADLL